jgi:hypothetical protein
MYSISHCNADFQFFGKLGRVPQTSISTSNLKEYSEAVKSGERAAQCILYRQTVKLCGPKSTSQKKSCLALPRGRSHHPAEIISHPLSHSSPFESQKQSQQSATALRMHGKSPILLLKEIRLIYTKRELFPSGFPPTLGTIFSFPCTCRITHTPCLHQFHHPIIS